MKPIDMHLGTSSSEPEREKGHRVKKKDSIWG